MTGQNTVVIAAAGAGKTTFLVREALKVKSEKVLITTYTESNEAEIRNKFIELNRCVPGNVVIMTWFKFLITHGVKPFQYPAFEFPVMGMQLVQSRSGLRNKTKDGRPIYWGESENFFRHYFNKKKEIYSDKLSKLVIRCDQQASGDVLSRLERVFPHIFIDEIQDLAGYDLDLVVGLFKSKSRVLLVGDPRQVIYLTHYEARYQKYANGGIVEFLREKIPRKVKWTLDDTSLSASHRNSKVICEISSGLYPLMRPSQACECKKCRWPEVARTGLYVVKRNDVCKYLASTGVIQLREDITTKGVHTGYPVMNFGVSKGRGFDHVLIFPTEAMLSWFKNPQSDLKPTSRAKLYVALTRARHSVAIVAEDSPSTFQKGFVQYV